jgi:hypothetical protein
MSMRKIMKKIFVETFKMTLNVFLRRRIFGELSVEYLGSISEKNQRGSLRIIFVRYLRRILERI